MDDAELMVKKEMELRARILGMYVVGVSRSRDRRRRRPTLTPPLSPPPRTYATQLQEEARGL